MKKVGPLYSADMLFKGLQLRHQKDLIVGECKNGPTSTTKQLRKLDAWVLCATWSPITTIGYEIKVSRADWNRDKKLDQYLGLCHLFYVVAPKGIIALDELPPDVGLIEALGNGTRLVARRRASRREIDLPISLMTYVLMSRVRVVESTFYQHETQASRMAALQAWALAENERRELGSVVNAKIKKLFREQRDRNDALERRVEGLESIRRRVAELGFDAEKRVDEWQISNRLRELSGDIDETRIFHALGAAERQIQELRGRLEAARVKDKVPA